MAEHTPTPWLYRPHCLDDWGWIRGQSKAGEAVGPIVATARGGSHDPAEWEEHRRNKTDPFEPNAAFIVKAVNNHDALVKALTDTLCELTACASQLAARGLQGRPDDSVSRAQSAARAVLGAVGTVKDL